jgi:UDP-N-acetylglucosamine--N-acetylmuramyl-(pentapeptide) pyrophosphoryl-undecaprenol N-acetylglucosamine transferase
MTAARGILFCGGGTGGHVLPGLAVAAALRRQGEADLRWIGDPERIEARLVPGAGIPLLPLGLTRPRLTSPRWILHALRTVWGCWRELHRNPPQAVVALGGYASLIPGLLAPLTGRPLIVMEQNARAGRTNRLLGLLAARIITQFDEAAERLPAARVRRLGNPVRAIELLPRGRQASFTVLVVGGSLAAKSLNDLVALGARQLRGIAGLKLIHIAGEQDRRRIASIYADAGLDAEVLGFVEDMPALYRRVDLAVTRAGATTVAELCAGGIGAIYIPLPWAADDHQTANARAVAEVGGAMLMPQATTRPEDVVAQIASLAADRDRTARLGDAAARLARPQAADQVARLVLALGRRAQAKALRRSSARSRFRARLQPAASCLQPAP